MPPLKSLEVVMVSPLAVNECPPSVSAKDPVHPVCLTANGANKLLVLSYQWPEKSSQGGGGGGIGGAGFPR